MSDSINYKAVRERIESSAKEIISERSSLPEESNYDNWESYKYQLEHIRDNATELAFESVSNWDWCIYTYKGFQVYDCLSSSESNEAESLYWDMNSGGDIGEIGPYELGCAMAMLWLIQRVCESIEEQSEELIEFAESQMDNY